MTKVELIGAQVRWLKVAARRAAWKAAYVAVWWLACRLAKLYIYVRHQHVGYALEDLKRHTMLLQQVKGESPKYAVRNAQLQAAYDASFRVSHDHIAWCNPTLQIRAVLDYMTEILDGLVSTDSVMQAKCRTLRLMVAGTVNLDSIANS